MCISFFPLFFVLFFRHELLQQMFGGQIFITKCVKCIRGMEYGNYSNVFLGREGSINFTFRQETRIKFSQLDVYSSRII